VSRKAFDFKHCPKCGRKVRLQVNLCLDIPADFAHRMSKGRMRSREARPMGVDWPNSVYYCANGACKGFMFRLGKKPCGCGGRFVAGSFVHSDRCDREA
jgi:hypothetical protein